MLFPKASRRIPKPRPVHLFGKLIQWVDTAPYLGGDPRYTADPVESYRSGDTRVTLLAQ